MRQLMVDEEAARAKQKERQQGQELPPLAMPISNVQRRPPSTPAPRPALRESRGPQGEPRGSGGPQEALVGGALGIENEMKRLELQGVHLGNKAGPMQRTGTRYNIITGVWE